MRTEELLKLKKNPRLQGLLENDPHRKQFSKDRWEAWEEVFWEEIAPVMKTLLLVEPGIYNGAQDYWLRSGIDEAIDFLERYAHMA